MFPKSGIGAILRRVVGTLIGPAAGRGDVGAETLLIYVHCLIVGAGRRDRLFLAAWHKPLKRLDWEKGKVWISLPSALIVFPVFFDFPSAGLENGSLGVCRVPKSAEPPAPEQSATARRYVSQPPETANARRSAKPGSNPASRYDSEPRTPADVRGGAAARRAARHSRAGARRHQGARAQ
jgi:hypothetical protein